MTEKARLLLPREIASSIAERLSIAFDEDISCEYSYHEANVLFSCQSADGKHFAIKLGISRESGICQRDFLRKAVIAFCATYPRKV
jgi:hypothetical protein